MGKTLRETADEAKRASSDETTNTKLEREILRLKKDRDTANRLYRMAEKDAEDSRKSIEILTSLDGLSVEKVPWASREKKSRKGEATALVMLSDLHLDEIVKPGEVEGMNAYNREIALARLKKTAEGAIKFGSELMSGFNYKGCIVVLGGDLVSGNLHDLGEFNETHSVIATVDYWTDHLAVFLQEMADAYGPTHVVSVVGNHGRTTRKPRTKGRVEDNFDHLIARLLQRHFNADKRFTWNIPLSADATVEVYDTRLLITHGDQAKGGSGISGLLTPVSLLDHRKKKRNTSFGKPHDHLFMGHFHTYIRTGTVTVGGSPKGLDEYAYLGNFGYEEPSSPFAIITPEHGVTIEAAIFNADRKAEGW